MVRNYVRKTDRGLWPKEAMKNAVSAILERKMSYSLAAKTFSIPRSTLKRKVSIAKGTCVKRQKTLPKVTAFSDKKEAEVSDAQKSGRTEYTFLDQPNTSSLSPSSAKASDISVAQPEAAALCVNIKKEHDDGSYDTNEVSNYKDLIPSTLCEALLNPENVGEKLPLSGDGPGIENQNIAVFGALCPSPSKSGALPTLADDLTSLPKTTTAISVNARSVAASAVPVSHQSDKSCNGLVVNPSGGQEHPLETFFRSMARTVLTFPPHLMVEAKMQVCAIVSEIEYRAIQERSITKECTCTKV